MKELDKTMKMAVYMEDRYSLEEEEIRELERPPMIEIPEYRRKRVVGSIEHGERASA
jgi:hypothetical protein